jgi:branched-subunit amino acid transport protein AzlD
VILPRLEVGGCAFNVLHSETGVQESTLVADLSRWMPAGVLGILAVTAFRGSVVGLPGTAIYLALALAVTIAVHLLCGRRTLLSVTLGTATFVGLVNLL